MLNWRQRIVHRIAVLESAMTAKNLQLSELQQEMKTLYRTYECDWGDWYPTEGDGGPSEEPAICLPVWLAEWPGDCWKLHHHIWAIELFLHVRSRWRSGRYWRDHFVLWVGTIWLDSVIDIKNIFHSLVLTKCKTLNIIYWTQPSSGFFVSRRTIGDQMQQLTCLSFLNFPEQIG